MRAYFKTHAVATKFCEDAEKIGYRTRMYQAFNPFGEHSPIDAWIVFYGKRH